MPALPVEREGRILRFMRFARPLGAGLLPVLGSLWSVAGCGLLLDLDPRDDAGVGRDAGSDAGASERCDDGVDDDGDGAADCLDLDCEADAACADLCNGVDDDGDGRIDESPADPTVGVPCFEGDPSLAGIGACVHGVTVCEGGALSCLGSGAPSEETCNGVDDDCDGALLPEEGTVGCSTDVVAPGATRVVVDVALPPLDVHANLDTTGSMGGVLAGLRAELTGEIAPRVRALLPDAAFGLSTFDDFPVGAFGQLEDRPFILRQRITTDLEALQFALDEVALHSGADAPESGIEALHQIATGAGVTWHRLDGTVDAVPAVDCDAGFVPGLGHGRLGGACFRPTALPVVVHVTDAQSHDGADYRAFDPRILAASATGTMAELRTLGARVVGIRPASTFSMVEPTSLLWHEGMATATGAVAPLCGFDGAPPRAAGTCAPTECCTGIAGAGRPPVGGECPLVFEIPTTGEGLSEAMASALDLLTRFTTMEIAITLADDPVDSVDARCFVQRIEVVFVEPPGDACSVTPAAIDTDGDGLPDVLRDASARTRVAFELTFENRDARDVDGDGDRTEACAPAGSYRLGVGALAEGRIVLSSGPVTITVP